MLGRRRRARLGTHKPRGTVSTQSDVRGVGNDAVSAVGSLTQMIRAECEAVIARGRSQPPSSMPSATPASSICWHRARSAAPRPTRSLPPSRRGGVVCDGSAGWCTMIGGCYAIFGGMLPPEGAREIFGDPATISAGNFRPDKGVAEESTAATGSAAAGSWRAVKPRKLVHRGRHARAGRRAGHRPRWAAGDARVLLPRVRGEVIDTWESTGLRGTASHDYEVLDVFVPEHRTLWFQEPPDERGPLYRCRRSRCSPPSSPQYTRHRAPRDRRVRRARTTKIPTMSQIVLADRVTAQAAWAGRWRSPRRARTSRARCGTVAPSGSRTRAHAGGSRRSVARRRPRRAHRARRDRHAVHRGGRHRGVRHEPAGPLPARCADRAAARLHAGGPLRARRPARTRTGCARQRLGSTTAARRELEVAMAAMRILVVGGGIAGLATARALAGAGFPVELVEREAEWSERARASTCPGTRPAPSARSASSERCGRERP